MNGLNPKLVEQTLANPDIHHKWEKVYRTPENEKFYEQAFDQITKVLNAPKDSLILDAGCGICAHSIRLANRGFLILSIDFSESVLKMAEDDVKNKGLENKIKLQREDILALSFGDNTFNYLLCWGVLMHIPDLDKAISEITRVLKPGGALVISENNMYSLQSIILRNLKRLLRREEAVVKKHQLD